MRATHLASTASGRRGRRKTANSSQSRVSQPKAHAADGLLSSTISFHDFPLRLTTVLPYGFVSGNGKNHSSIGNFLARRASHLLQHTHHLATFPSPGCLDGCWRGESDGCEGSRKVDHLYEAGLLAVILTYLDHADARTYFKSALGFFEYRPVLVALLKKLNKFSRNFLTCCDSHSTCLLKNLRGFITQLEAGYQRTGTDCLSRS